MLLVLCDILVRFVSQHRQSIVDWIIGVVLLHDNGNYSTVTIFPFWKDCSLHFSLSFSDHVHSIKLQNLCKMRYYSQQKETMTLVITRLSGKMIWPKLKMRLKFKIYWGSKGGGKKREWGQLISNFCMIFYII